MADEQEDRREITPVQRERHKHSPLAALSLLTAAARIDPTLREAVATVERAVGAALVVAWLFVSYDGSHHKQWVIAEMVKRLTGTDYDDWVENLCGDEFEWDEGTPP